jgi:hypothetical protein
MNGCQELAAMSEYASDFAREVRTTRACLIANALRPVLDFWGLEISVKSDVPAPAKIASAPAISPCETGIRCEDCGRGTEPGTIIWADRPVHAHDCPAAAR